MKMNMSIQKLLVVSVLLVLLAKSCSTASSKKMCVFKCLKEVIKCKRDVNLKIRKGVNCCEEYFGCYRICSPGGYLPSCQNSKPKRGSWNKRTQPVIPDEEPMFPDFSPRDLAAVEGPMDADWDLADTLFP